MCHGWCYLHFLHLLRMRTDQKWQVAHPNWIGNVCLIFYVDSMEKKRVRIVILSWILGNRVSECLPVIPILKKRSHWTLENVFCYDSCEFYSASLAYWFRIFAKNLHTAWVSILKRWRHGCQWVIWKGGGSWSCCYSEHWESQCSRA